MKKKHAIILTALTAVLSPRLGRADTITFSNGGQVKTVKGNVVAKDALGTLIFEGRDSQQYLIRQSDRSDWRREEDHVPYFTARELREHLIEEYGDRFGVYQTNHYTICHSCSELYAKQAGTLFERAFSVFHNYFKRQGSFKLTEPELPLIAIVFASKQEYVNALLPLLGPAASATSGVYVQQSNRMYMYDAFGGNVSAKLRSVDRRFAEGIALLLKEQNISVVIHEAIHQIAYNSGFHNRQVENPVWLVEGMAMFFEAPDLDARGGWRGIGSINRERFVHLGKINPYRHADSLRRLVIDDRYFRGNSALDAYAEAWGLTYYLAKKHKRKYMDYIRLINDRPPIAAYTPEERLGDFRKAFGKSPEDFEADFQRFMKRQRP